MLPKSQYLLVKMFFLKNKEKNKQLTTCSQSWQTFHSLHLALTHRSHIWQHSMFTHPHILFVAASSILLLPYLPGQAQTLCYTVSTEAICEKVPWIQERKSLPRCFCSVISIGLLQCFLSVKEKWRGRMEKKNLQINTPVWYRTQVDNSKHEIKGGLPTFLIF